MDTKCPYCKTDILEFRQNLAGGTFICPNCGYQYVYNEEQFQIYNSNKALIEQRIEQYHKNYSNLPTCPHCGSTSITTGARGVSGFWGFIGASKTVNRCANCGHTWTPKG